MINSIVHNQKSIMYAINRLNVDRVILRIMTLEV